MRITHYSLGEIRCQMSDVRGRRSLSNVPGFPRHTQNLGASRRKAGPASANLDIFWLKDESLEDRAKLLDPHIIAQEEKGSVLTYCKHTSKLVSYWLPVICGEE